MEDNALLIWIRLFLSGCLLVANIWLAPVIFEIQL
jgi:hypothetical protein